MSGYTKRPWFTQREGFSTVYVEARIGGGLLQEVAACGPTKDGPEQQEANARLISAAPDLLEALEAMLDDHIRTDPHHAHLCPLCLSASAAIQKAKS